MAGSELGELSAPVNDDWIQSGKGSPAVSPEVLKAFVASPRFHGTTKLK
jgi:hypothetical protein